jgi:hypothetical protein
MRESRTYGFVRGAHSDMRPYRDLYLRSPLIVEEYRAIARRPKFHRFGFPPLWLEFLIEESMYLSDPVRWPHAGPDLKDMPFLALAHSAGVWLVTGNLRHFPQEIRKGVTVLSPTDYLAHLMKDTKPRLEWNC